MLLSSLATAACKIYAFALLLSTQTYHVQGNDEPRVLVPTFSASNLSAQINELVPLNDTTVLPDSSDDDGGIVWPAHMPFIPPTPTVLSASSPRSSVGPPKVVCNSRLYGKNLNGVSCIEAWDKMTDSDEWKTYGQRGSIRYDANLPFRILSSDGLCAFDISTRAGVIYDSIIPTELKANARTLLQICVAGTRGQLASSGGVVSNIGVNGGLAIRVTKNNPGIVSCDPSGTAPPRQDCRDIIDTMPADGVKQVFGRRGDPFTNITSRLPAPYQTERRRCQILTDFLVPELRTDTYDWYKLWAAANAVDYMCVEKGKAGLAIGLGELPSKRTHPLIQCA